MAGSVGLIQGRVQVIGSVPDPRFETAVAKAMRAAGDFAFDDMRRRFEPHNRTDRTQDEMRLERRGAEGFRLWNPLETAGWIEFGTPAHPIDPRTSRRLVEDEDGNTAISGGVLRWFDGGAPIFATHVDHPGTDADPFMEPAVTENAGLFEEMIAEEVGEAWRRG